MVVTYMYTGDSWFFTMSITAIHDLFENGVVCPSRPFVRVQPWESLSSSVEAASNFQGTPPGENQSVENGFLPRRPLSFLSF